MEATDKKLKNDISEEELNNTMIKEGRMEGQVEYYTSRCMELSTEYSQAQKKYIVIAAITEAKRMKTDLTKKGKLYG